MKIPCILEGLEKELTLRRFLGKDQGNQGELDERVNQRS
jgi:hypothetical protein